MAKSKLTLALVSIALLSLIICYSFASLNRTAMLTATSHLTLATASSNDPRGPQITVPVGTTVTVYIKVSGPPKATGTLKVEVRKDIVYATDQTKAWLTQSVTIPDSGLTDWIKMGTFVADELTTGQPYQLREYFIKVYWNDNCIYDPTNPDTREWVKTYQPTVTYQAGEFEG